MKYLKDKWKRMKTQNKITINKKFQKFYLKTVLNFNLSEKLCCWLKFLKIAKNSIFCLSVALTTWSMKTSDKILRINIIGFYYEYISILYKTKFNYLFFKSKTINTMVKSIDEQTK